MEISLNHLIKEICEKNGLNLEKVLKETSNHVKEILDEYDDPDIHLRCKGRNKNGKRCSKCKKENSEYCSVHYNQQKDKDNDFIDTEKITKQDDHEKSTDSSSIHIIENSKGKGILPEKVKRFVYESKKYYINKNDVIYEMDQNTEMILSDIPVGRMIGGKLILLNIGEI